MSRRTLTLEANALGNVIVMALQGVEYAIVEGLPQDTAVDSFNVCLTDNRIMLVLRSSEWPDETDLQPLRVHFKREVLCDEYGPLAGVQRPFYTIHVEP